MSTRAVAQRSKGDRVDEAMSSASIRGRGRIGAATARGGTPDEGVERASERVTLACRALAAAVRDLQVAHKQSGVHAVDDAAASVAAETERVCELAEEVVKLAANLGTSLAVAGRGA